MKRDRRYREPWTTPWKVFFDRVRRGDINRIQSLWVCLMLGVTLSGLAWIVNFLSNYPEFLLQAAKVAALSIGFFIGLFLIIISIVFGSPRALEKIKGTLTSFRAREAISSRAIKLSLQALKGRPKFKTAPGTRLLSVAEFFYSPKTVEEVFKPIIADWRTEYFDALTQNRSLKARWISVRYKYHFVLAMGLSKVYSLFRSILSARK